MCNYTDVMSETGSGRSFFAPSCFIPLFILKASASGYASVALIIISASLLFSGARLSLGRPSPEEAMLRYSSQVSARGGRWLSEIQYVPPIGAKELNETLPCYLSGRFGYQSVPS